MTDDRDRPGDSREGATAVITHRVKAGRHGDYEAWLEEIAPLYRASPGALDWHVVRPIPGLTDTFTVILRFDTADHLRRWMDSPARARLIQKAQPLFVTGDDFFVRSGLDFWFAPGGAAATVPTRWKQYLVTWSAIFPLALGVPLMVTPLLRRLGVGNHLLSTLVVTGTIVFLMVYLVMPRYTKVIKRWLFS